MCQNYNSRILTKGFYMFFKKYFLFFSVSPFGPFPLKEIILFRMLILAF